MDYVCIAIAVFAMGVLTIIAIMFIRSSQNDISPAEFTGLMSILVSQIEIEINVYEKDIFNDNRPITNNNYDNYYRDLTHRIISKLSPKLIRSLTAYYTEDAIYSFIAKSVRNYLLSKVQPLE